MQDQELTLQEVADELGVHYMTAYRYVRIGVLPAHKDGRSWKVRRSDLESMGDTGSTAQSADGAPWPERLASRLVAGDEPGAWGVVEAALAAGASPAEVLTDIIPSAMRSVGDRWVRGEIGVDTEHTATLVCSRLLPRLGSRFARRGVSKGTVVLGTTAQDLHSLPLAIAAELLRVEGYDVRELGAFLPPEDFAHAVSGAERLIAVGVGMTVGDPDAARETVTALKAVTDTPIFLGGSGVPTREDALEAGANDWAATAAGLLDLVDAARA